MTNAQSRQDVVWSIVPLTIGQSIIWFGATLLAQSAPGVMPPVCHSQPFEGSSPTGADKNFIPRIWRFGEVGSCLDTAANLAARGWLEPWDSVQVVSQTAGRGQLRRQWHSPAGNVYAALRLPLVPPFDGTAAAPAVGALLAEALAMDGWQVRLKWPNDLVLCASEADPRKLAGILLEERGGVLLAGIGINVRCSPPAEQMRADAALEATSLAAQHKSSTFAPPMAEALWQTLVKRMEAGWRRRSALPAGSAGPSHPHP